MLKEMALKCLNCKNPSCEKACPLHNRIASFINEIKNDNLIKAREILDETSPFPYICSYICDYKRQCFGNCIRNKMNDPVYVYELEKAIASIKIDYKIKNLNNCKIAIIGSGIAGLSLAKLLAIEGYVVDIYEKENFIGGTIKSGIPEYRLDPFLINKMIDELKELNVNFILNKKYPLDINITSLKDLGYHKIVFAIGAMKSNFMRIKNHEYALDGLKLLYDLNINHNHDAYSDYRNIYVVGGGNVAMDCARSLIRINKNVNIIYRRSINEMPANDIEILEAKEEGVKIIELQNPKEILIKDNKVVGFIADKMCLGEKDASGRASFKVIEGQDENYKADLIVMAIGQKVDITNDELTLSDYGTILVDNNYKTNVQDVYAIGDCISGPTNVARAMYDAKNLFDLEFKEE